MVIRYQLSGKDIQPDSGFGNRTFLLYGHPE